MRLHSRRQASPKTYTRFEFGSSNKTAEKRGFSNTWVTDKDDGVVSCIHCPGVNMVCVELSRPRPENTVKRQNVNYKQDFVQDPIRWMQ